MIRAFAAAGVVLAGVLSAAGATRTSTVQPSEQTVAAQLRPIDQALLDAIATGESAAWQRVVAPGFTYVAENEQAIDGPTLLSLLKPPKPTDEGADVKPFRIVDYSLHLVGDTATVLHHDAEQGTHLGSRLTGMDVTTEVWQRIDGRWLLRLVHTTPVPTVPPAVSLSESDVAGLVGRYRAGDELVTVSQVGDGLTWQADGRAARPLSAEARDVLFEPGNARIRYIFHRDASGRVVAVLRRNENRAIAYGRLQ